MKRVNSIVLTIFLLFALWSTDSVASFLEEEAGISASTSVTGVDLALAESAFKTIEKKTAAYIVGSVAIDGYDEKYDVHVYVDDSGQMVAYYLKSEPASKIIDWITYAGTNIVEGSKLENALTKVCNAMAMSLPTVKYFDFRHPQAMNVKIIADEETISGVTETFRIMIPDNYVVYNQTWSHGCYRSRYSCELRIDGTSLNVNDHGVAYDDWKIYEGEIPISMLSPENFHELQLVHWDNTSVGTSYAGVVLVYSETP